jgi:hypothetical protein
MIALVVICLCQYILVLPVLVKTKSAGRFLLAGVVAFFGVTLPNLGFYLSAILAPESKDACQYGWIDCFIQGKIVLAPLAIWATAALYALEVLRVKDRTQPWIVLGMLSGTTISIVCFLFWILHFHQETDLPIIVIFWIFPFCVAAWYTIRTIQLIRAARLPAWQYFVSQFAALQFWAGSYVWSKSTYDSLPATLGPGCFIVTAASRGHAQFTGPHTEIIRHGRQLRANGQLLTFWELESRWRTQAPRSHATFRRVYNQVGPIIAGRIKSPWLADAVYLGLKPLEIIARGINGKN